MNCNGSCRLGDRCECVEPVTPSPTAQGPEDKCSEPGCIDGELPQAGGKVACDVCEGGTKFSAKAGAAGEDVALGSLRVLISYMELAIKDANGEWAGVRMSQHAAQSVVGVLRELLELRSTPAPADGAVSGLLLTEDDVYGFKRSPRQVGVEEIENLCDDWLRLRSTPSTREPPHCSTCECGMEKAPDVQEKPCVECGQPAADHRLPTACERTRKPDCNSPPKDKP